MWTLKVSQNKSNKNQQKIEDELELQNNEQTIIEFPQKPEVKTHSGRKIIALERLTY